MKRMTEFMKRGTGQIDELVSYINQTGAGIKAEEVECIGAMWRRDAVLWRGTWYLVYTDSTKTNVKNIDKIADEVNRKYSELEWGRSGG